MSNTTGRNYGSINTEVEPNVSFAGSHTKNMETEQLLQSISNDIFKINSNTKSLENCLKSLGTPRDSQGLRDQLPVTQHSTKKLVSSATINFNKLASLVRQTNDKKYKLQMEKLKGNFEEAINSFSRNEDLIVRKLRTTYLPSEMALLDSETSSFLREGQTTAEQRQATNALEFEKGLLLEREQRILKIENSVLDINQIMKELGATIHAQGEDINSIENAIENVHENTELGERELEKAVRYETRRRKKTCFLLGIAVIIVLVLVFFIWVSLR